MEGQSKILNPTKRIFLLLLALHTLFITNIYATSSTHLPIPVPANFKYLTYNAVPIFANTLTTFDNLKSAHAATATKVEPLALVETSAMVLIAHEEALTVPKISFSNTAVTESKATVKRIVVTGTVTKEERRKDIAYFAESHTDWGFRYRYGGTNVQKGIDCSGFTRYVFGYFDINTARTAEEQYQRGNKIPVEEAKAGDLVFFSRGRGIDHVAVVVSNDKNGLFVVHSTTSRGIVKENVLESDYWRSKLRSTAVDVLGN